MSCRGYSVIIYQVLTKGITNHYLIIEGTRSLCHVQGTGSLFDM